MEAIESPCINICRIDPVSRLCLGCLRDIDEITRWRGMTAVERQKVIAALPARADRIRPPPAPSPKPE